MPPIAFENAKLLQAERGRRRPRPRCSVSRSAHPAAIGRRHPPGGARDDLLADRRRRRWRSTSRRAHRAPSASRGSSRSSPARPGPRRDLRRAPRSVAGPSVRATTNRFVLPRGVERRIPRTPPRPRTARDPRRAVALGARRRGAIARRRPGGRGPSARISAWPAASPTSRRSRWERATASPSSNGSTSWSRAWTRPSGRPIPALAFTFLGRRGRGPARRRRPAWPSERGPGAPTSTRRDREDAMAGCARRERAGTRASSTGSQRPKVRVWVRDLIHVVRVRGAHATILRGLMVDITERKRAEQALRASERKYSEAFKREREAAQRLRMLDEMKNTFLEAVSHDLRTPLTSILGSALTLERSKLDLPPEDALDMVAGSRRTRASSSGCSPTCSTSTGCSAGSSRRSGARPIWTTRRDGPSRRSRTHGRPIEVDVQPASVQIDPAKAERILENLAVQQPPPHAGGCEDLGARAAAGRRRVARRRRRRPGGAGGSPRGDLRALPTGTGFVLRALARGRHRAVARPPLRRAPRRQRAGPRNARAVERPSTSSCPGPDGHGRVTASLIVRSRRSDSNRRPSDYKSLALPAAPRRPEPSYRPVGRSLNTKAYANST